MVDNRPAYLAAYTAAFFIRHRFSYCSGERKVVENRAVTSVINARVRKELTVSDSGRLSIVTLLAELRDRR